MTLRYVIAALLLPVLLAACGGAAEEELPTIAPTSEPAGDDAIADLGITPVTPPEVEGLLVPVTTPDHEFELIFPNEDETWSIAEDGTATLTNGEVTLSVFVETFDAAGDRSAVAASRYPGASVAALDNTDRPTYVVTDENLYEIYVSHETGLLVYGLTAEEGDAAAIQDTLVELLNGVNINQLS